VKVIFLLLLLKLKIDDEIAFEGITVWKEISNSEPLMMEYTGALPKKLYRYRSIVPKVMDERLINFEILEEAIFLAGLKDLNDPDEGRFLMKFEGERKEIYSFWKDAIQSIQGDLPILKINSQAAFNTERVLSDGGAVPENIVKHTRSVLENIVRIASFTTDPVNYSMWANYAKYYHPIDGVIDHAGICIEYECDKNWLHLNLHPVEYSDVLPILNPVSFSGEELVKTLYMKTREWRGEEEWRIMSVIQAYPPFSRNLTTNSKIKISGSITGVIFGIKTPDEVIKEIISKVSLEKPDILFKKIMLNPTTYKRELVLLNG